MKRIVPIVTLWLLCFYITGAGMWASWHADFYGSGSPWDENKLWGNEYACRQETEEWTITVLISIIPATWIGGPFTTGFYQDGFDWHWLRRPCKGKAR
jgi:hypothetical protein